MTTIADLTAEMPRLHNWNGEMDTGGLTPEALTALYELALAQGGSQAQVVETGAGSSTLAFLLAGASKVIAMAPDQSLFDQIEFWCLQKAVKVQPLEKFVERSETALPGLAQRYIAAQGWIDLAFMDGAHGWPTVFVDFCYLSAMLRPGGMLVLDDTHLHSVKEVVRFLNADFNWRFHGQLGYPKTLAFQKQSDQRWAQDFGGQPYIVSRTQADAQAGRQFIFE